MEIGSRDSVFTPKFTAAYSQPGAGRHPRVQTTGKHVVSPRVQQSSAVKTKEALRASSLGDPGDTVPRGVSQTQKVVCSYGSSVWRLCNSQVRRQQNGGCQGWGSQGLKGTEQVVQTLVLTVAGQCNQPLREEGRCAASQASSQAGHRQC